jgi:hypothetical protein
MSRRVSLFLICMLALPAFVLAGCAKIVSPVPQGSGTTESSSSARTDALPRGLSSQAIVQAFRGAGLPIGRTDIYYPADDSAELLASLGHFAPTYTARFVWQDSRLDTWIMDPDLHGGAIEFFDSEDALNRELEQVKTVFQGGGAGIGYVRTSGLMLMLLDEHLTPIQAEQYNAVLQQLGK